MNLQQYAALSDEALDEMEGTVFFDCPVTCASIPIAFAVPEGDNYGVWVYNARDNEVLWGVFPGTIELRIEP